MITAEQRQLRKSYIGSSDAAAILGVDPYRSAYDVWAEKTGRVDGFAGNDATEAGNFLESAVLDWAEAQPDVDPFLRNIMQVRLGGPLAANFDGLGMGNEFVVEAKTTGIVGYCVDENFGEVTSGPDVELPDRVIVQVHHQFLVAGPACRFGWVPALIGGQGFRKYRIERNDELCGLMEDRACEFMDRHVAKDTPPENSAPSPDVLKRIRRQPNKIVEVPALLADRWIMLREARLAAEKAEKAAQCQLIAALGDAEAGQCPAGLLTYFEQYRARHEVKPSTFRTLKLKTQK